MQCLSCGTALQPGGQFCGVCGTRVSLPASDPFIGKTISNRYIIDAKIGEGGFGAVYQGRHTTTERPVAIKFLHPTLLSDSKLSARFRREGLVMCKLRDPHIITTYEFEEAPDGTLFIVMELLKGISLQDVLDKEAPISWQRQLGIITQVCDALQEAHNHGIVHRDLKPENIHLEEHSSAGDFVKVLDFGIAKVVGGAGPGDAANLTAAGQTLGTLEYMSPEQLMGQGLDGRSDIYTLGVVSYELMTGQLPFPEARGPAELITSQLHDTPAPPSSVNSSIPPLVDRLVLRMLGKTPDERFSDAADLKGACNSIIASSSGSRPQTVSGDGTGKSSKGLWLALAALVVVAGLATAAYFLELY